MSEARCSTCGGVIGTDDAFCGSCGARATANSAPLVEESPSSPDVLAPVAKTAAPALGAARFAPLSTPPRPPRVPAGFWNRLAAWLIDFAILWAVGSAVSLTFSADPAFTGAIAAVTWLSIIYRPLMWRYRNGQTIGQQALKICAIKDDGMNLSIGRGVWRVLATWITGFIPIVGRFNVLSMLWNDQRRCWFDRWSDTRVDARVDPRLLGFFTRS